MKTRIRPNIVPAAIAVALFFAVALVVHGATITVTNTNDSGPGSLRQALASANDGDTITVAVSGTIVLTTGELLVDKNVTIEGPGAASLAVDGNASYRVFRIGYGKNVTISGLTITNGLASGDSGGGIYNDNATLTLSNCSISSNSATFHTDSGGGQGGGILSNGYNYGATLRLSNCTISGNSASAGGTIYGEAQGGGIFNSNATLTLSNCAISGNSAIPDDWGSYDSVGGGIYNEANSSLQIRNCTISGNSADRGGGIINGGSLDIGNTVLKAGASGRKYPQLLHGHLARVQSQ